MRELGFESDIALEGCSSIALPKDNSIMFCLDIDKYIDNLIDIKNSLIIINKDYNSNRVGELKGFNFLKTRLGCAILRIRKF